MGRTRRIRASARATVTLQVDCGSTWGPDCTAQQILEQASSDARSKIASLMSGNTEEDKRNRATIRVVGEPVITSIIVDEEQ